MPTSSNAPKRPASISVDFTGIDVSRGLRRDHVPEGDYLVKVIDCVERRKKDDKTIKMLNWHLEIVEPKKYAGKKLVNNTVLVRESLWALRSMLVDMLGESRVPASSLDIPIAKIVKAQKQFGVTVEDDEYNGKMQSQIRGTFSKEDWANRGNADIEEPEEDAEEEEEEDDEEDTKKKATSSDDDEDMDEIDVDDI